MKIRTLVITVAAMLATALPAAAELRHVEIKSLGMD